ncbi:MAG: protein-export chaperone SecB [Desulfuromonadales bacterium]
MEDYTFQFVDYRLISLNFSLKGEVNKKSEDIEINPSFKINREFDKKELKIFLEISMNNGDLPFEFNVIIGGLFKFSRDVRKIEKIEEITNINCAAILFPFLRETVADLTRRAGFPPLLLPPVNFCKIHNELTKLKAVEGQES